MARRVFKCRARMSSMAWLSLWSLRSRASRSIFASRPGQSFVLAWRVTPRFVSPYLSATAR
jgi:hypothetical protein